MKPGLWKAEAGKNAGNYSPENLARMREGKAPIGTDGFPTEIHHKTPLAEGGKNNEDNFQMMTQAEHRRGDNYKKNHPNLP